MMQKTFIERIAAHNEDKSKKPIAKNKVAFLILKDDIADALEKGCSITAIWETLHEEGEITTTYNTFRLKVAKYINGQTSTPKPTQREKATKSAFTYNPKADISHLI
tara:strand:- start:701 stop:1021 length:321 start_codon:yes stop_codon:yes gene_type:complete